MSAAAQISEVPKAIPATQEDQRHTYGGWQSLGRQVKKGARRGIDGKFAFDQTKAIGRKPSTCCQCGARINYGRYCGKCEFS
jgi:hypothetical protein